MGLVIRPNLHRIEIVRVGCGWEDYCFVDSTVQKIWCHLMSDFKAEMLLIPFPLGLRPWPHWGAHSTLPDSLAVFKGPTSKGRGGERKGRVEDGKSDTEKGWKGEGESERKVSNFFNTTLTSDPHFLKSWLRHSRRAPCATQSHGGFVRSFDWWKQSSF